jgi:thiamine transport system ATP-binding protein
MVPLAPSERPISILFQDHNLFNHITVEDNVGLGIKPNLKLNAADKECVETALERVGLGGKAKRLPSELSGGERQRTAFARVLVQNRKILLLDEPFASLGPSLRAEMTALLAELRHEKHLTILAVTHHPHEWGDVADHFIFVDTGTIVAHGPIKDLSKTHESAAIKHYLG